MKRDRMMNAVLVLAIALVWSVFAGLIVWGYRSSTARDKQLSMDALDRLIIDQRERMSMALRHIEQDLREEAAFVGGHDSLSDAMLRERWVPVLQGDWVLTAVALANEAGEMQELARVDDEWRFSSTIGAQGSGQPLITEWPLKKEAGSSRVHIGDPVADPRRSLWFGQALGEHTSGATWSTMVGGDSTELLNASMIIRSDEEHSPYRVIRFTLSPGVLVRSITETTPQFITFHLSSEGRPWHETDDPMWSTPLRTALDKWTEDRADAPFTFQVAGKLFTAAIQPDNVSGMRLYTGCVLDLDQLKERTSGERLMLWTAALLLLALGVLLVTAYQRGRRRARHAERQERQSISQERRLAKAISERETLDREVHHRVKNNLQVVSSLLHLQAERVVDPGTRNEFTRGKRRIDSMALVHHKLYAQTDLRAIDLRLFMDQIAVAVRAMYEPGSRGISHAVNTGGITANADTAIQLGMILCELLANAYLHAFPYITGGHIDITVQEDVDGMYRLTVSDNGKGMERRGVDNGAELGLELAEGLAEQIDGRLEVSVDGGTRVDVYFRMQGEAPVHGVR